ncbi:MAG: hypothetical protein HYZ29_08805 [Myxococcales bacterium]|nr:hypothetical protein [Myxococcales bacterium]
MLDALRPLLTPPVIAAVTVLSLALLVGSVAMLPWFVARLPRDYFVRPGHDPASSPIRDPGRRRVLLFLKNAAGAALLVAGLAMLVLPGQGVLTILVALVLLDFPGKRALERRLVARPAVGSALNAIRRRAKAEPLLFE